MAIYLVTGGAGFIGSHLVHRLVADGYRVRVVDNLSTGKKSNLAAVADRIDFIEGDLREAGCCARACAGVEVVFHIAALPSVPRSIDDPVTFHENNIDGTFRLLWAAREARCRRVVYAGSSSAYGDQPESPKRESMSPAPLSPYALNKLVGEYYGLVFFQSYGLETITLRYFNVFGPRQDPRSQYAAAIPAFISAVLQDQSPTIYGDGEQTRDFTYIDNVVEANCLAAAVAHTQGEVVNVACGESVSVNYMLAAINRELGKKVAARYEPARIGDVRHSAADISRARSLLGYQPQVSFDEGLRRAIHWYRENSTVR
ncbi:MAG: UDP-N-acetylglucosamine 4-epimerase [Phycisphaerae bacterium]|nr:UDP-N-acetylglucosamine 4-epimerase [Phycisphaerae bacterium]